MDVDLAVVGAGPAGAATALLAARAGYRVACFDQARFPRDKPCGEGLMPSGRAVLRALDLERPVLELGAPDLRGVVFGLRGREPVTVPFPGQAGSRGEGGLGVRRLQFDALLAERLTIHPNIAFSPGVAVRRVSAGEGRSPSLETAIGEVCAGVIVLADGLRSSLRHQLGRTRGPLRPYRYGVIGHWHSDRPVKPWIRIVVGDGAELYQAPVSSGEQLVALLCRRPEMAPFAGGLASRYRDLAVHLAPELETAQPTDRPTAIGPFRYEATSVASDGVFLVGDAAGFVDPITGEGLAAGLRQAQALVRALTDPCPESAYRRSHRQLTRDPRRVARLLVYLTGRGPRSARGIRGVRQVPAAMSKLLGINLGYWGFDRITPREWLALLFGR